MKTTVLIRMDIKMFNEITERVKSLDTDKSKYLRGLIRKDLKEAKANPEIVTK